MQMATPNMNTMFDTIAYKNKQFISYVGLGLLV